MADVIQAIAEQPSVGAVAEIVQPLVRNVLQSLGTKTSNVLHGTWLGHPLHPALVSLPIGAWSLAFVFDALELVRKKKSGNAELAIAAGILGAVASAVTGLADWSETDDRAKKIGLVHGSMNLLSTSLYISSLATRRRSRSTGIGLSMIAFGVANAAAWLGGHLVFAEQIGVNHTEPPSAGKPEKFVAVLGEGDLRENQLVRVDAGGVPVLLVRKGRRIYALAETCTHLGGPLSEGKLEGSGVRCPWHGSRFCIDDGSVLEGPATHPARTFDVRVRDGNIEVRVSSN